MNEVDFEEYHKVIRARTTNPSANIYEIPWWDDEIKLFVKDIWKSMEFIRTECTDKELWYLGKVTDDIPEKTHSVEFHQCFRERVEQMENPQWKKDLLEDVQTGLAFLPDNRF